METRRSIAASAFTEKWVNRKRSLSGRRLDRITSVNARHAHKDVIHFKQEAGKQVHMVVPKNKVPLQQLFLKGKVSLEDVNEGDMVQLLPCTIMRRKSLFKKM